MVVLPKFGSETVRAVVMALIWGIFIAAISWTMLKSLFNISNNARCMDHEGHRSPRSRCIRRGRARQEFPPCGAGATRLGLQPEPAAARTGGAARGPADEPHHPQRRPHGSRRTAAGRGRPGDLRCW